MWATIREWTLPLLIGTFFHSQEKLGEHERDVEEIVMTRLQRRKRTTRKPVIVALVGLVGSGKSAVARELAKHIGATVIGGDDIRIELRKRLRPLEKTRAIAESLMQKAILKDENVIIDSDFIDPAKRASLRQKARNVHARVLFVRTVCNYDVMVDRVMHAPYESGQNDFFASATTLVTRSQQARGAAVKLREMWRRTPLHYLWEAKGGGTWTLRKLSFRMFAKIDTTDAKLWPHLVKRTAHIITTRL